jgi:glucose-6-phosphate 1-dehydrogenase
VNMPAAEPQALVVFGASGDLAKKKLLPALYELGLKGLLPETHRIIGVATSEWDDEAFRIHARAAVEEFGHTPVDERAWEVFARSLSYVAGSFGKPDVMRALTASLDAADGDGYEGRRLYYLAVPPQAFGRIIEGLGAIGANTPNSRVVIEKPFGASLASARELTGAIHEVFDESQVFRIDHYLGKETVQNLGVFRFANSLFERVWNRDAIDHVQLTVAESIGVQGRAAYYDRSGAIRDLLQNHMLQVLSFATMEPPRSLEPEALRDEKVKLLRAVRPLAPEEVVRGRYVGYLDEEGVAPDSTTETFFATPLFIDNWRWEGVPFFLRHGKRLPTRSTELTVVFRQAPDYLFRDLGIRGIPSNHLTVRIQPDEGISLAFQAKAPGPGYELQTVGMDFDYERSFMHEPAEAYERLLHDAMGGDHTLFTREDGVDRAWEIVGPLLDAPGPICNYEPGSWGPPEADELISPRRWHLRDKP